MGRQTYCNYNPNVKNKVEIKGTFYQSELQKVDVRDDDMEYRENSEDERKRKQ